VQNAVRGRAAFNVADFDKTGGRVDLALPGWQRLLLVICAVSATAQAELRMSFTASKSCHLVPLLCRRRRVSQGTHERLAVDVKAASEHVSRCAKHNVFSIHGLDCRRVQFVNLMALMAAWVYVFDTIQKEREMLEQPEQVCFVELLHLKLQLVCEHFGILPHAALPARALVCPSLHFALFHRMCMATRRPASASLTRSRSVTAPVMMR